MQPHELSSPSAVAEADRRPLSGRVESLLRVLCCPKCHAPLEPAGDSLRCTGDGCGTGFPTVQGVPVLVNEARSVFTIAGFLDRRPTFFRPAGPVRRWLSRQIPDLSHNLAARRVLEEMRRRLLRRGLRARVLVIGGGVVGAGLKVLLDDPAIDVVETDAGLSPRVQIVCDAHDLPFRDGSFDAVIVQAVLEHVVDPVRCVDEVHRVLGEGGLVYADTPFICQVHGREYDFTRFTRLGHRRLFRRFGELESGISSGPGMALGWTLRYFLLSFFTRPALRAIASAFCRAAFFWLKYLDYLMIRNPAAMDAAFAFYFLGEKRVEALCDRELIRSYRGGFPA